MDVPKNTLDDEIQAALDTLEDLEVGTEDYDKALKHLKALCDIKKNNRISPDGILVAATNILGILLVLNFERLNVVTSRALMFIKRSN